jgi:sugar fermentation stimulation protein A
MELPTPLLEARLVRRYKRFLADAELGDGSQVTAHCPNTGSMLGCDRPGSRVWLSHSTDPRRKLAYTWELVEVEGGVLVGINTSRTNRLVHEALEAHGIPELAGYDEIAGEVRFGSEGSRVDLFLSSHNGWDRCFVEVKNVTAAVEGRIAVFPDAVTQRGTKHLRELMRVAASGDRAVLCFCVQRPDVDRVEPADQIDPVYGRTLREAIGQGVEVIAYGADVSVERIVLRHPLPVVCPVLEDT